MLTATLWLSFFVLFVSDEANEELTEETKATRAFLQGLTEKMGVPAQIEVSQSEEQLRMVLSGENMSIYAAANIAMAISNFRNRGYADLAGLILNRRDVPDEQEKAEALAAGFGTQVIGALSRSPLVPEAEERGQCLLQAFPQSEIAEEYRRIAGRIVR